MAGGEDGREPVEDQSAVAPSGAVRDIGELQKPRGLFLGLLIVHSGVSGGRGAGELFCPSVCLRVLFIFPSVFFPFFAGVPFRLACPRTK